MLALMDRACAWRYENDFYLLTVRRQLGGLRRPRRLAALLRRAPAPLRALPLRVPRLWRTRFPVIDNRYVKDTEGLIGPGFPLRGTRFNHPYGVAPHPAGGLVVADTFRNRVVRFDAQGKRVARIVHAEEGRVPIVMPMGVAVSSSGSIFVQNSGVGDLHRFDGRGRWCAAIGPADRSSMFGARGICTTPDDELLACDTRNRRLVHWDREGRPGTRLAGTELLRWKYRFPTGVATSPEGVVAVCDMLNHRVEIFAPEGNHVLSLGGLGDGLAEFNGPAACTFVGNNRLLVLEWAGNRLQSFSLDGRFLEAWCEPGSWLLDQGLGYLCWAGGLAYEAPDALLIADTHNHRVQRLRLSDTPRQPGYCGEAGRLRCKTTPPALTTPERDNSLGGRVSLRIDFEMEAPTHTRLKSPQGLVQGDPGEVWIADTFNNRVVRWTRRAGTVQIIGRFGKRPGSFINPTDVCLLGSELLVVDSLNSRVQRFDREGRLLGPWPAGDTDARFQYPRSIAVSDLGAVAIAEPLAGRITIRDTAGRVRCAIDAQDGSVRTPVWVRWHEEELLVADFGLHKILVFSDGGRPGLGAVGRPRLEGSRSCALHYPVEAHRGALERGH